MVITQDACPKYVNIYFIITAVHMNCCNVWLGSLRCQVQYLPHPDVSSTIVRAVNDRPKSTFVTSWRKECSSSSSECNDYYKEEGQGRIQPLNRWHTFDYDGCFILKRILLSDAAREFLPIYNFRKNRNSLQIYTTFVTK